MYKVRIKKEDYLKTPFKAYNIKIDDVLEMDALEKTKEAEVLKNYKMEIYSFLKNKISFILGFIFFIICLVINSNSIDKIIFNSKNEENELIETYLRENINQFLNIRFLKKDIHEMSKELRIMFEEFEYIELKKDGNDLNVIITKTNLFNSNEEYLIGDVIAKKDGIIKDYYIKDGISNIYYNKYVKKGDVLISSNDKYQSSGIVMAEVSEYIDVKVLKKEKVKRYRSYNSGKAISLFNKTLYFNKKKKNCDIIIVEEKNYVLFKLKNVSYYETIEYEIDNTYEEALFLSKQNIESSYDYDLIKEEVVISHREDDLYYYFTYFVKSIQNIGIFRS